LQLFSTFALAIFIEVIPFLALGALISALVEVFVSQERMHRLIPKSVAGGLALGIGAGVILPTCECGVVPIVRRLIKKGVPPYMAIAYMLAAPIINPVVLLSTYMAFNWNASMVFARIGIAVIIATTMGLYTRRFTNVFKKSAKENIHHHHKNHEHDHSGESFLQKSKTVLIHAAGEFMEMGKYVIIGALASAAFKTFIPMDIMITMSENLTVSIIGMLILAILLSICSEADAFVASSFQSFPMGAKLAFIGIGPMVDLKLIGMYGATFKRGLVYALIIGPTLLVFILSWLFEKFLV